MGRSEEFGGSQSPVEKYLSWSSASNSFEWYNKEEEAREPVDLPYVFIVLKEMHTVGGWCDKENAAIFSNNIVSLQDDILTVKIKWQPSPLVRGLYNDIKDKVKAAGGKYTKMLYVFDGSEIHAVTIKGAALTSWINFTNENRDATKHNFITVASFVEKKKGKTDYSEPVFTIGEKISDDISRIADNAYDVIKGYLNSRASKSDTASAPADKPADNFGEGFPEASDKAEDEPLPDFLK